jgi:hypothetical protein
MLNVNLKFIILIFIISLVSSCAPVVKEKSKKPTSPVVVKPVIVPKKNVDEKQSFTPPEQQDVLILLSSSSNAYQKIAAYLIDSLGEHAVQITLSGLPAQDKAVIMDIKASSTMQIVALGLKALNAVKGFKNKQIIYTQIISHENLISDNVKAVSSLPSPEKLFKDWKKLSPRLSKVAIVSGSGLDLYLNRAKKAAAAEGIELIVELVSSDKGFIYNSKKLRADVGGQWILPDNRILSGKALKDVMAFASRRGRQIVVFSPKLLSFGGFFYVNPDLQAIAEGVLKRLADSSGESAVAGDSVLPIMNHTMGINQNIARQLNLTIPPEYQEYINGK